MDEDIKRRTVTVRSYLSKASGYRAKLAAIGNEKEQKAAFNRYFDRTSLIDYLLLSLLTANYDGFNKNYQWTTYDGTKWFVTPYDLDGTFGMFWKGFFVFPPEWTLDFSDYKMENFSDIFPFNYIKKYYWEELKERYCQLRKDNSISAEVINSMLTEWHDKVGDANYQREWAKWPDTYCIQELTTNDKWATEDNWTGYSYLPQYDDKKLYHKGDRCTYLYRVWTAACDVQGVRPWAKPGYRDSLERITEWVKRRVELEDEYLGYDSKETAIPSITDGTNVARPVGIYTITGQKTDHMVPGINIVVTSDGRTRKVLIK